MRKKNKKFWTPMRIIVTIILLAFFVFFLLKIVGVDFNFLSTSTEAGSKVISGAEGFGGGIAG